MITSQHLWGFSLTLFLAWLAQELSHYALFQLLGPMLLAILLGMLSRMLRPNQLKAWQPGFTFSSKIMLRLGIILMGLRLNLQDILAAGWPILLLDLSVIGFTLIFMIYLGDKQQVAPTLTRLIAVGSGVCGAAAIGAVAPILRAKPQEVALSVAIIATLGTLFTLVDTGLYHLFSLSPHWYGIFTGATLHELAHVIAASSISGIESSNTAILVKLGRVAFIAPVAMILGYFHFRHEALSIRSLPIPWFILGFLAMAGINTLQLLPGGLTNRLTFCSILFITMAMAGMGLSVTFEDFHNAGAKPLLLCFLGSLTLMLFGLTALWIFQI